jgi:dTDP-4-amino-4,6-dideoxygalactose transaminase
MSFQPFSVINIPSEEHFATLVRKVFSSGRLTNNGAAVRELEARLADYLGVEYLVLTSSGTLALQIAYRALELKGEVITSPFSWVTTVSSLLWVGLRPRFVDIDARTFNINAARISAAVTPASSAVLAVHTFGNPADVHAIEAVSRRHGLRTIYDAAHAFGTTYSGRNVVSYGDASILSLHATKLFHTVEGGAVILKERAAYERAKIAVNNGIGGNGEVQGLGINGRLSELHAIMGLALLEDIDGVIRDRRLAAEYLRAFLRTSSSVQLQQLNTSGSTNHGYMPLVFLDREARDRAIFALTKAGFIPRTYFDTALNRLPFMLDVVAMPVTESLTERILCLPLRIGISTAELDVMGRIIAAASPVDLRLANSPRKSTASGA